MIDQLRVTVALSADRLAILHERLKEDFEFKPPRDASHLKLASLEQHTTNFRDELMVRRRLLTAFSATQFKDRAAFDGLLAEANTELGVALSALEKLAREGYPVPRILGPVDSDCSYDNWFSELKSAVGQLLSSDRRIIRNCQQAVRDLAAKIV